MEKRPLLWVLGPVTVLLVAMTSVRDGTAQDAPPPELRRFEAGPLTRDEFKGRVPDPLPRAGRALQMALTECDLRYEWRYRYTFDDTGYDLWLTRFEMFATFNTEKSWLSPQAPLDLLDHEQGHFDITQIHALQMQAALRQLMAEGRPLRGRGKSEKEAAADLKRQLDRLLGDCFERANQAQRDYDRRTQHGLDKTQQADQRKRQLKVLKELAEKDAGTGGRRTGPASRDE